MSQNFVFYRLIERIRPCTCIIQRKCPFTVRLRRRKHTQTLRGYELSSDCSVWNHRNKEYFTWHFKFDVSFLIIFHSQSRGVHNKWNYYRSKKKTYWFFLSLCAHMSYKCNIRTAKTAFNDATFVGIKSENIMNSDVTHKHKRKLFSRLNY